MSRGFSAHLPPMPPSQAWEVAFFCCSNTIAASLKVAKTPPAWLRSRSPAGACSSPQHALIRAKLATRLQEPSSISPPQNVGGCSRSSSPGHVLLSGCLSIGFQALHLYGLFLNALLGCSHAHKTTLNCLHQSSGFCALLAEMPSCLSCCWGL